jgi:hypothetical protein
LDEKKKSFMLNFFSTRIIKISLNFLSILILHSIAKETQILVCLDHFRLALFQNSNAILISEESKHETNFGTVGIGAAL